MPACPNCDAPLPTNGRFCGRCGAPIESGTSAAPRMRRSSVVLIATLAVATLAMVVVAVVVVLGSGDSSPSSQPATTLPVSTSSPGTEGTVPPAMSPSTPQTSRPVTPTAVTTTTLPPLARQVRPVAQELASDLAAHDWVAARRHPLYATTTDETFEQSYGGLQRSTVIPVRAVRLDASTVEVRLGLVAWEDVGAGPRTNVYCVTWTVDMTESVVVTSDDFGRLTPDSLPGHRPPSTLAALIRSRC
jgi:hypothetical protein